MSIPLADATSCCGCGRRNAVLVLAVLLVVTVAGWAIMTAKRNRSTANILENDERVEIWVAATDLPVGTLLNKDHLTRVAVKKSLAKDRLPVASVLNEEDLYSRRVSKALVKDEAFSKDNIGRSSLILLEGEDMISLPISVAQVGGQVIGPGSKVDVLATMRIGKELKAFPILVDVRVVAVEAFGPECWPVNDPNLYMVSFAATQKQALVLALAKQRGSHLELLLQYPGRTRCVDYDIDKVLELLQEKEEPSWTRPLFVGQLEAAVEIAPRRGVRTTASKIFHGAFARIGKLASSSRFSSSTFTSGSPTKPPSGVNECLRTRAAMSSRTFFASPLGGVRFAATRSS